MVTTHRLLLNQLLTIAVLSPSLTLAAPPATPGVSPALTAPETALEGLQGIVGLANKDRFFQGILPLLKEEQELLFLQGYWHYQKPRHLLGIGLGHRILLNEQWGVGYNLFFDHDNSQHHHQVGLGGELWADWAKLALNGYIPASKQRAVAKQSVTSRPAKGFDLGLQGYLPQHPQLGASIRYAYSVGDQVAGYDTALRQKNPQRWLMGISYTPVPLVTVEYSHQSNSLYRKGSDHRVGATVRYQLGLPLAQQCDPTQVALLRSLSGQLLSPVSRQCDIALSYRQGAKQGIKPVAPPAAKQATGVPKAKPKSKPNNPPPNQQIPQTPPWKPHGFKPFDPAWTPTTP